MTLDAVDCRDFPVVDGAEASGVIASTVVEGSGEMALRDLSRGLKVLEFRAGFNVFYLWIDDRNSVYAGPGCVELARYFAHFGLLANFTGTLDFGLGPKQAVSDHPRE